MYFPSAVCTTNQIVARTRAGFRSLKTLPKEYREHQLRQLKKLLVDNEKKIQEALWHDLGKVSYLILLLTYPRIILTLSCIH